MIIIKLVFVIPSLLEYNTNNNTVKDILGKKTKISSWTNNTTDKIANIDISFTFILFISTCEACVD